MFDVGYLVSVLLAMNYINQCIETSKYPVLVATEWIHQS